MAKLSSLNPERVFYYFEQISGIPRGSGNCNGIALYCRNFAINHNLEYVKDKANNVVIFKPGTPGYESSDSVILQGHTDIVCQKTPDCNIDFVNHGLDIYVDGDFVKAENTTLGADNGIAVAMMLAILESDNIPHPPIEAVFTSDEEIGLLGAGALDISILKSKKMINLDSEDDDTATVSCAGGSELRVSVPLSFLSKNGTKITLSLSGLKGGHSGIEINNNRVNANTLAGRLLNHLKALCSFDIISINGGDKSNAIPNCCDIELCVYNTELFIKSAEEYLSTIKRELSEREKNFSPVISVSDEGEYSVFSEDIKNRLIFALLCAPNGIIEMSAEVPGLVETSLNLGILKTENDKIILQYGLRSNKKSGLDFIEEKVISFFNTINWQCEASGHYPPWEYKEKSSLRNLYIDTYREIFRKEPKIEAIHAGLECGIFASAIDNLDCISIGPALYDVHTVNEKLCISSTENVYNLLLKILENIQ